MRRLSIAIAILLLLTLPVSAFSGISSAHSASSVSGDGSCQVSLTLQLTLDALEDKLVYPLPAGASNITVNGSSVSSAPSGNVRNVDLSKLISSPGSYSLAIRYTLPDVILRTQEKGKDQPQLTLNLELLSGFAYPIERLEFSLELPGPVAAAPTFTSTYYQGSIETMMTVTQDGNTIRGEMPQRLQDHEKLVLSLPVTEEMFPQPIAKRWSMDTVDLVMLAISGLAILYWLVWLRCPPMKKIRRTAPPDGITAGEVHARLKGQGADLTMMVLSWAQMGYVLIQPEENGRVLLHKRMDMGSERDDFELKWFRKLYGKRQILDGTGYYYARLCQKAGRQIPGSQVLFLKGSGDPKVLRFLAAAVGAVSGVSLAAAYGDGGMQVFLSLLLGLGGFAIAWVVQSTGKGFHSRHRRHFVLGLISAAAWLLLSIPAGEWGIALIQMPLQFVAGLAAFYGGRRSETGRINAGEILGLRDYLKTMSDEELQRNLSINPQYYYDVAPYALALGIDRAFARKLKNTRLPECPYLTTGMDGHLTATEWNQLLRDTVASMDALQSRLPLNRLLRR